MSLLTTAIGSMVSSLFRIRGAFIGTLLGWPLVLLLLAIYHLIAAAATRWAPFRARFSRCSRPSEPARLLARLVAIPILKSLRAWPIEVARHLLVWWSHGSSLQLSVLMVLASRNQAAHCYCMVGEGVRAGRVRAVTDQWRRRLLLLRQLLICNER